MLTREDILRALDAVIDQGSGQSVVAAGMISGVTVREGGKAGFLITIAPQDREKKAWLEKACEQAVAALPGVTRVTVVLTAEAGESGSSVPPLRKAVWNSNPIPHVMRLLAVASGKGGVGKSTTAVNLAHALHAAGKRVGLLDADVYGPSIPRMMGISGKPEMKDGAMMPLVGHGIACMSMGLMVGEESALAWRGPQLSKALSQMLRGVAWGTAAAPLDALLIDMPPGTGDIHISLAQQAPLDGAIIVTTPQDVAVADARKCIDMFAKLKVPVLGVIENMSGFTDETGRVHAIFGSGGGRRLAEACGLAFLGEVPIDITLRETSDMGTRFADKAEIYGEIAARL